MFLYEFLGWWVIIIYIQAIVLNFIVIIIMSWLLCPLIFFKCLLLMSAGGYNGWNIRLGVILNLQYMWYQVFIWFCMMENSTHGENNVWSTWHVHESKNCCLPWHLHFGMPQTSGIGHDTLPLSAKREVLHVGVAGPCSWAYIYFYLEKSRRKVYK